MEFDYRRFAYQTLLICTVGGLALPVLLGAGGATPARVGEAEVLRVAHPRVVVLKHRRLAYLFDGDHLVKSYPVDLGFCPLGDKVHDGDGRTPEGCFRVVARSTASPYHRFLGLGYPDDAAARRGERMGLISRGEAASIRQACREGRCPNWSTVLGGGIGLHGGRRGRDWTAGCMALTDDDIEELFEVLRVGDPVEILP